MAPTLGSKGVGVGVGVGKTVAVAKPAFPPGPLLERPSAEEMTMTKVIISNTLANNAKMMGLPVLLLSSCRVGAV